MLCLVAGRVVPALDRCGLVRLPVSSHLNAVSFSSICISFLAVLFSLLLFSFFCSYHFLILFHFFDLFVLAKFVLVRRVENRGFYATGSCVSINTFGYYCPYSQKQNVPHLVHICTSWGQVI